MKVLNAVEELIQKLAELGATGPCLIQLSRHDFEVMKAAALADGSPWLSPGATPQSVTEIVVETSAGRALLRLDPDL